MMSKSTYVNLILVEAQRRNIIKQYHKAIGYLRPSVLQTDPYDPELSYHVKEKVHWCNSDCYAQTPSYEEYMDACGTDPQVSYISSSKAVVISGDYELPVGFVPIELYVHLKDLITFGYFPRYGYYFNDAIIQDPYSLRVSIVERTNDTYFYIDGDRCSIRGSVLTCYSSKTNLETIGERLGIVPKIHTRYTFETPCEIGLNHIHGSGYTYSQDHPNLGGKYMGKEVTLTRDAHRKITTIMVISTEPGFESILNNSLLSINEDNPVYSTSTPAKTLCHRVSVPTTAFTKVACNIVGIPDMSNRVNAEWERRGRTRFRSINPSDLVQCKDILEDYGFRFGAVTMNGSTPIVSGVSYTPTDYQPKEPEYKHYNHSVYKFIDLILGTSNFVWNDLVELVNRLYSKCRRNHEFKCPLIYFDAEYLDSITEIPDIDIDVLMNFLWLEHRIPRNIRLLSVHTPDIYPTEEIYYDVLRQYRAQFDNRPACLPEIIPLNKLYVGENRQQFVYNRTLFTKEYSDTTQNYPTSYIKNLNLMPGQKVYIKLGDVYRCEALNY